MKKKALRKDFYMEIKRSLGRFLSIFFIVAIGVAFFSGIRSGEPDMRLSGDAYFDKYNLMDIQVLSTMGLSDNDLNAIREVEGIEAVEGGRSVDMLCMDGDNQVVIHVMELTPTMNQVTLEEGRMPEAENECVIDVDFLEDSSFEIGDKLMFSSGTDDDVTDFLTQDQFTIVGAVSSPCYIAFTRGNSTIGTGSIGAFVCVPEESFSMKVYTEIFAKVKGADKLTAFTSEYDDAVEKVVDRVEEIKSEREAARREEVIVEAHEELDEAKIELADAEKELAEGKEKAEKELAEARQKIADGEAELANGRNELASAKSDLEANKAQIASSRQELKDGQAAIGPAREQLKAQENALVSKENQVIVLRHKYEALVSSGADDEETKAQIETMRAQVEQGEAEVAQARAQIEYGRQALDAQEAQITAGLAQLDEAEKQIADGERQISSAEAELASGEAELEDGRKEYEKGEKEAREEIKEGEEKLADAKKELAKAEAEVNDIGQPKWYVYDRGNLPEYDGYGENADRMRAIGEVFPVLFFLVAALISLTTMTRMVEEQRTQIGTLKALGYSRRSIAGKYLGYAFLATISGCIVGVLAGESTLPKEVLKSYSVMYKHMHEIVTPYNMDYALLASGAALACTLLATFFACYKELRAQSAELMRPPTPKQGQRVALERMGFIWSRLNFTWKATVRNLVRYKKRFFMTIFGIGGCMALLLVGYGLADSMTAIGKHQYGELQTFSGNVILDEEATQEQKDEVYHWFYGDIRTGAFTGTLLSQITMGNGDEWISADAFLNVPENKKEFEKFVLLQDRKTKEKYKLKDDGAIITEKVAVMLELEEGDTIYIRDDEKGDLPVKIAHICENYMAHYIYMTPAYYEEVYGEPMQANSIYYTDATGSLNVVEAIGQDVLKLDGTLSVSYTEDLRQQVEDMLATLGNVTGTLVGSAALLAFVVLYNLNNINITERKRELATLKVLGFYNNEVSAYVYRENIILTLIGSAVGVVLGLILHRFIITTVEVENVMFGRSINPISFVYGFLLTIGFSLFVNWVMYFKLKRINMVESLKSVE